MRYSRIDKRCAGLEILASVYLFSKIDLVISDQIYVNLKCACLELGITTQLASNEFARALDSMIEKEVIAGERLGNSNNYRVDPDSIYVETNYVSVPTEYVIRIARSDLRKKYALLTFYLQLLGTRDSATMTGHYSQSRLAEICGITVPTVERYMGLLEELGVIEVKHNRANNGYSNIYGLPHLT